jgi:hypothetical protein
MEIVNPAKHPKPETAAAPVVVHTPGPAAAPADPRPALIRQARTRKPPLWWSSFLASNMREKTRLRGELAKMKGVLPLLMKPRNGGQWTSVERSELLQLLKAASSVSPYLLVMALPGSVLILPILAWHLDVRRKGREALATTQRP